MINNEISRSYHMISDNRFYDYILDNDWNMKPVDRSLDKGKIKEYLSRFTDENDKKFIKELLSNTLYVNFKEFKTALIKSFNMFKEKIGMEEFYILTPSTKIGSEDWLIALLWKELKNLNMKGILTINSDIPLKKNTNILIIDDAIYSGVNTVSTIDNFTYDLANAENKTVSQIGEYFTFHLVIPFYTENGMEKNIKPFCKLYNINIEFYGIYEVPTLLKLIDIHKYYGDDVDSVLSNKFGIQLVDMPPIYFDHKVAGYMSTYSSIYLLGKIPNSSSDFGHLFKVRPSREKIEELSDLYEKNRYSYIIEQNEKIMRQLMEQLSRK